MHRSLFLIIILCVSIFTSNQANENEMPESLRQDILNGEVQKVIEHLNKNPNDINLKVGGFTALMLAIQSDSLPMFNEIISRTENVNEDDKKTTPLIFLSRSKVSQENQLIFAELLLQKRALIDAQSVLKDTALIFAISHKNFKLAKFLINNDANIHITNQYHETAFFIILTIINKAANENIKKEAIDVAKLLIQKGTDLNHINYKGLTPLMVAIFYLNIDLIVFLLNNGAKINFIAKHPKKENDYDTALNHAIYLRNVNDNNKKKILYDIIQLLIDKKAKLSILKINDIAILISPLAYAIEYYDFEIIKLLVEAGSKIQEKDLFNKNALDNARKYYQKENDPKIKQIRKRILKYLENPYQYIVNEDRAIFASTFFNYDKETNVPADVANMITNYIHEPEKTDDIDQLKEYLRNSDIDKVKSMLAISPTVLIAKDEMGDTPLILMIKYYYHDKYINKVDESVLFKDLSIIAAILQNLLKLSTKEDNYLEEQLKPAKILAKELKLHILMLSFKQYEQFSLKV